MAFKALQCSAMAATEQPDGTESGQGTNTYNMAILSIVIIIDNTRLTLYATAATAENETFLRQIYIFYHN